MGVVKGCLSTEAGGGDCWCRVDEAAAAVNPKDRRAAGKRRKVEENSLKVLLGKCRKGGDGGLIFVGPKGKVLDLGPGSWKAKETGSGGVFGMMRYKLMRS